MTDGHLGGGVRLIFIPPIRSLKKAKNVNLTARDRGVKQKVVVLSKLTNYRLFAEAQEMPSLATKLS